MTETLPSGAHGDPSHGAPSGSFPGDTLAHVPQNDSQLSAEASAPDDPAAESSGPDPGGTALGDAPRRRRGGARRRRGGRAAAERSDEGVAAATREGDDPGPDEESPEDDPEIREAAGLSGQEEGDDPAPARKRRRRRRRKPDRLPERVQAGQEPVSGSDDEAIQPDPLEREVDDAAVEEVPAASANGSRKRRRRRRRRSRAEPERSGAGDGDPEDGSGDAGPVEGGSPDDDDLEGEAASEGAQDRAPRASASAEGRGGRRRRGRGRGRKAAGPVAVEWIPGEDDELEERRLAEDDEGGEEEDGDEPQQGAARGRKGGSPREGRKQGAESEAPARRRGPKNIILVNAADREETRVAVVESGRILDFQMTSKRHKSLVNDIYRGRVVNLEPAIGAAFVDFGQGRNGFLHTSDVLTAYGGEDWKLEKLLTTKIDPEEWDEKSSQPDVAAELDENGEPIGEGAAGEAAPREEPAKGRERGRRDRGRGGRPRARPRLPISDLLEKGDGVVVQVTKEAIGDKGPTLTTYISIPGRYLVLMPSMARTGVSRKIEDEKERRRLKRILEGLDVPPGMGVIVRTAGIGCTKAEIKRDLDYLLLLWDSFGKRLGLGRGPAALYEESDVAIRTIRDLFSDDTEAVIVDDPVVHERVREFVEKLMPENLERIKLHTGPRPLFHTHNVEQDFERIFARRIDLPSGGSIVIDQTEALVAIDVNSGKTRSDGFDFEDIALRTNLDAVPEIARQIRLRDLGGILVIDFIDMLKSSHRRQVERALRDALAGDRARSKLGRISQFGLLELTRQRLGPGLSKMLFQNCPRCRGSGRLRTVESRSEAILRRLGSALTLKGFTRVEVRAAPEVVEHLEAQYAPALKQLEERHQRELVLIPAPDQLEDSVLRYLRADGREVRPGGRRKR